MSKSMPKEELDALIQKSGIAIKRFPEAPRKSQRELEQTRAERFFEKCERWQKKSSLEQKHREQRRRTKRMFVEGRL